jgi:tRNA(Ile)-lysidine synthase
LLSRNRPAADAAFSPERIDALFAPFAKAEALLLAVSGGPDSTALLLLAARWAAQCGRPRIEVATVDHAMRADSRGEAEAVAALSGRLGLNHHLIEWRGAKPRSRIQERAREARYQLLGARAREIGADYIVTAHHADDQAETVLFRLIRGSGIGGLAGMAPHTPIEGAMLARPLLGMRKAELVAFCEFSGEDYARDPSNADPRFARTHLRELADLLAAEGLGADEIVRLSGRASRMEEAVVAQTEAVARRLGWTRAQTTRDARALFDEPQEIVQRLLTAEIARVAGKTRRQIRLEAIETLARLLREAHARGQSARANVGGASVHLSAKGELNIGPEAPRRKREDGKSRAIPDALREVETRLL